jgi:hypothetical protein
MTPPLEMAKSLWPPIARDSAGSLRTQSEIQ